VVSARQTRLLACHVLLTYLPSLAGCGGEDARSSGPLVRDSAGVRIVENKGPRWPGATGWRLSHAAVLDIGVLEDLLLRVSHFVEHHPAIKELDINPILAYSDGALAVDARVILESK